MLAGIDVHYTDPSRSGTPLADQLVRQLASPRPRDVQFAAQMPVRRPLAPRRQGWDAIAESCRILARRIEEQDFA